MRLWEVRIDDRPEKGQRGFGYRHHYVVLAADVEEAKARALAEHAPIPEFRDRVEAIQVEDWDGHTVKLGMHARRKS